MRRIVAYLFLAALLFSTQPVSAQGGLGLASVDVWIWPEYDQPAVLVIYRITVAPEAQLPAAMTFRIPAAAIKPSVVAVGQTATTVSDIGVKFSQEPNGDWLDIKIEVTGPAVQLEYYDPNISKQGRNRSFVYQWPGDYAVQTLRVELQQPYDASNMVTNPILGQTITEKMTYHAGSFGPFAAGESFSLNVSYQKQSDEVSVALMPAQADGPVNENTAGRFSFGDVLPWLAAGAGVLLVAGGLYSYVRGQPRPKKIRKRRAPSAARVESAEGPKYCGQCGTRARPGDRFCRACGSRIREGTEE
ncbi:MAG: zinc ribbon domain-containing protein [Chloroflexota bacterium]